MFNVEFQTNNVIHATYFFLHYFFAKQIKITHIVNSSVSNFLCSLMHLFNNINIRIIIIINIYTSC